jgi:hypothetical protein
MSKQIQDIFPQLVFLGQSSENHYLLLSRGKELVLDEWGIQRKLDQEHVERIENTIRKEKASPITFGAIELVFIQETGKCYMLDGQHRYEAYRNLFKSGITFDYQVNILICETEEKAKEYFEFLNTVKPLSFAERDTSGRKKSTRNAVINVFKQIGVWSETRANWPIITEKHFNKLWDQDDYSEILFGKVNWNETGIFDWLLKNMIDWNNYLRTNPKIWLRYINDNSVLTGNTKTYVNKGISHDVYITFSSHLFDDFINYINKFSKMPD